MKTIINSASKDTFRSNYAKKNNLQKLTNFAFSTKVGNIFPTNNSDLEQQCDFQLRQQNKQQNGELWPL